MVMYDRETESWWQQARATGIVGLLTGTELKQLPSWMESWDQFKARNPRWAGHGRAEFPASLWRQSLSGL